MYKYIYIHTWMVWDFTIRSLGPSGLLPRFIHASFAVRAVGTVGHDLPVEELGKWSFRGCSSNLQFY